MKTLLVILPFISFTLFSPSDIEKGQELFRSNCESCHVLDKVRIGPPLACAGHTLSEEWIHAWLADPDALIASGDSHAVAIYQTYQIPHPYLHLNTEEVSSIIQYLNDGCNDLAGAHNNP